MPRQSRLWLVAVISALFLQSVASTTSTNTHGRRQASDLSYEYIVVGSGAGGGPLASRLARAGYQTLLIESGDDQGATNDNYSVPGYQAAVTQDPQIRWDFFVNHYREQARAQLDPKYVTGKGILYPRAGTLGGCVSHNALIWITPQASDWDNIANITGDSSWSSSNMAQYLSRVYEWQPTGPTDPTILTRDLMLAQHLVSGAAVTGQGPTPIDALLGLGQLLLQSPNAETPSRDSQEGFFQIPLTQQGGARHSVREFIVDTVNAGFPLTLRTNCFVTKVDFDTSGTRPRAVAVEFLDGRHLYRASPLSGDSGTPGLARATREVILAGGTYNSVQLLKLSGIGPQSELQSFNVPVLVDSPGIGDNMQDRYEIPVNVKHPTDFSILEGCTFDMKDHDKCYRQWLQNPNVLALRGAYASNGLAAVMAANSRSADTSDIDLYIFPAPANFKGYFPQWGDAAVADHQHFSWLTLKAHTRNKAGTVQLTSADPLETPLINFNYFDTGTTDGGADQKDLDALVQAISMSREALREYSNYRILGGSDFVEENPGADITSDKDLADYVKSHAWGHHACCTNKIGADNDPMAVLDSQFRVKGTEALRVVDASVFPDIPGIFIQAPIFMVAEKAADVIVNGA